MVQVVLGRHRFRGTALLLFQRPQVRRTATPRFLRHTGNFRLAIFRCRRSIYRVRSLVRQVTSVRRQGISFPHRALRVERRFTFAQGVR